MTDLELVEKCAQAMQVYGCDSMVVMGDTFGYWPLNDDAQCFALVKKFHLNIGQLRDGHCKVFTGNMRYEANGNDLNRAICECVAGMRPTPKGVSTVNRQDPEAA